MPIRRRKPTGCRAVTLIEIIVALVILSLVMGGMANLFVSSRRWGGHAGSRLAGSSLAGYFLSMPKLNVSAQEWDSNCIGHNDNCAEETYTLGTRDYIANYSVSSSVVNASNIAIGDLRRLMLRIRWNETTP